jgi:hypothetical protein
VNENLDITLGALFQDVSADGHGDVNLGRGDFKQVRSRTRASTTSGTSSR